MSKRVTVKKDDNTKNFAQEVEERKKRQTLLKEMLTKRPQARPITEVFREGFTSEPNLAKLVLKLFLETLEEFAQMSAEKHVDLTTVYFDLESSEVVLDVVRFVPNVSSDGVEGSNGGSKASLVGNIFEDLVQIAACDVNARAKWSQFSERVSGLTDVQKILSDKFMGSIDPKNEELISDPNAFISKKIYKVAELRKLQGDSTSEVAHRNAGYAIKNHPIPIKCFADATKIKGVGPKIAAKIDEILDTGTLSILEDKSEMERVMELFQTIWGVGPENAKKWFELGCRTIEDIKVASETGKIKLNRNQKVCFDHRLDLLVEMKRKEMEELYQCVVRAISMGERSKSTSAPCIPLPFEAEIVGSYRRGKQASKDVDVLIYPKKGEPCNRIMMQRVCRIIGDNLVKVANQVELEQIFLDLYCGWKKGYGVFSGIPFVKNLLGVLMKEIKKCRSFPYHELALGNKKLECMINLGKGWRRLDVFVTSLESLACAHVAFTGPGDFNRMQREVAQKKKWLLNEMNLYDEKGDVIPTNSEKEVFEKLGMKYLEPKDRK